MGRVKMSARARAAAIAPGDASCAGRHPNRTEDQAMKVLVIGAAGKTGRLVIDRALAAGYSVKALVHDTEALVEHPFAEGVQIVQGDVHDPKTVHAAVTSCEAVIDTLGGKKPFLKTDLESSAARVVLAAMNDAGVKRLIVISMLGAGDSGEQAPFWYEHLLLPTFLHGALPDKNALEAEVQASGLEWVLVRPPMLTDDAATGSIKVIAEQAIAHKITRGDLAQFLVDQITSDAYLGQAVVIANS
jgi:uncharacterized protein YbjT (DUF2867 family)